MLAPRPDLARRIDPATIAGFLAVVRYARKKPSKGQGSFSFDESKHPRGHKGNPGQFSKKGAGKAAPKPADDDFEFGVADAPARSDDDFELGDFGAPTPEAPDDFSFGDFDAGAPEVPESAPEPSAHELAPPRVRPPLTDLGRRIARAYYKITGGERNVRAYLADIRAALPDVPHAELDRGLLELAAANHGSLYPMDDPLDRGRNRAADARAGALRTPGGEERHFLYLDADPDPARESYARKKPAKGQAAFGWKEEEHPRDHGKFSTKEGESAPAPAPAPTPALEPTPTPVPPPAPAVAPREQAAARRAAKGSPQDRLKQLAWKAQDRLDEQRDRHRAANDAFQAARLAARKLEVPATRLDADYFSLRGSAEAERDRRQEAVSKSVERTGSIEKRMGLLDRIAEARDPRPIEEKRAEFREQHASQLKAMLKAIGDLRGPSPVEEIVWRVQKNSRLRPGRTFDRADRFDYSYANTEKLLSKAARLGLMGVELRGGVPYYHPPLTAGIGGSDLDLDVQAFAKGQTQPLPGQMSLYARAVRRGLERILYARARPAPGQGRLFGGPAEHPKHQGSFRFDESKHPREHGKFATKEGAGAPAPESRTPAPESRTPEAESRPPGPAGIKPPTRTIKLKPSTPEQRKVIGAIGGLLNARDFASRVKGEKAADPEAAHRNEESARVRVKQAHENAARTFRAAKAAGALPAPMRPKPAPAAPPPPPTGAKPPPAPAPARPDVDSLRKAVQAGTHKLKDVIEGTHPIGVEGRGGKDLAEAKAAGLYTTTVGNVGVYARDEAAARPMIDYLEGGGKYGTPEFSKLLGYSDRDIDQYRQFLEASGQRHLIGDRPKLSLPETNPASAGPARAARALKERLTELDRRFDARHPGLRAKEDAHFDWRTGSKVPFKEPPRLTHDERAALDRRQGAINRLHQAAAKPAAPTSEAAKRKAIQANIDRPRTFDPRTGGYYTGD